MDKDTQDELFQLTNLLNSPYSLAKLVAIPEQLFDVFNNLEACRAFLFYRDLAAFCSENVDHCSFTKMMTNAQYNMIELFNSGKQIYTAVSELPPVD